MNNTAIIDSARQQPQAPGSDRFLAAARELVHQAQAECRHTARVRSLFLIVLLAVSALLAIPTGQVFIAMDWLAWLAYGTGMLMHTLLAFTTHWTIGFRKAGNRAMSLVCGAGAAILIVAFLIIAFARANYLIEGGTITPMVAYAVALVYWLVECSIPVAMGGVFATLTEKAEDRRTDLNQWKRHMGLIDTADSDAEGAWSDAEAKLKDKIAAFERRAGRYPEEITYRECRENEQRQEWLAQLFEAHPGKRYTELNEGSGAGATNTQSASVAFTANTNGRTTGAAHAEVSGATE